jgi:protein-tyrosine phosphatase
LTVGDLDIKYEAEHGIKEHMLIKIEDNVISDISVHFIECIEFIERNRNEGRNILVHCRFGVSRSAAIAIAYYLFINGGKLSFEEAFEFVEDKRYLIRPNGGFIF